MPNTLNFNPQNLYQNQDYFIRPETVKKLKDFIDQKINLVEQNINSNFYDFLEILKNQNYISKSKDVYQKIKNFESLVVVGIGGSDLGARAIYEAFGQNNEIKIYFIGDSTDPVALHRLLKKINLKNTLFNIISKSGGTLETMSVYLFFKNLLKQELQNWPDNFVFTTGNKGILFEEAAKNNILKLEIPAGVGGRFSVLSPVGLLPALAMGVDIDELVRGALDFAQNLEFRTLAQDFARSQYELYDQDIKICVLYVYSVQLQEFGRWFRQLWAECLGKDGRGILPIKAYGPADQHSQGQFYNQGEPMLSYLFLKILTRKTNYTLQNININNFKYLNNQDFNKILNTECDASAESLLNHHRPTAMLEITELTAYSLGQLFIFFELAVVYLAEMLEVNAFDQPGVEEGKRIIGEKLNNK